MSDSPYELQRLVTVGTFSTPWEAQIARARLDSEGLPAWIANEHVIRLVALSNAVGGIQLKVREGDAAAAAAVLRRLAPLPEIYLVTQAAGDAALVAPGTAETPALPETTDDLGKAVAGPAAPSCPACGGDDLQLERSSRRLLGLVPVSRQGYRCGGCGVLWRAGDLDGPAISTGQEPGSRRTRQAPAGGRRPSAAAEDTALCTVARFHTPWQAHLARTFLESEGLRCCVLEERLPAVHLLSAEPVAHNRLEVRQADAARAGAILARAWSHSALMAVPETED